MTDAELQQIRERLAPHRVHDWEALHSCRCYTEDTCTLDLGCPFAVHCLEAEEESGR